MEILKKLTPYVIIAALVAIILFQEGCFGKKTNGDVININGKKYEVIKHEIDTFTDHFFGLVQFWRKTEAERLAK